MKQVLLLFLLGFCSQINAQVLISGTVTDNKGKPANDINITLKDSYDGSTTDSAGHFHFKTMETGNQTLVFTSIGFQTYEEQVSISNVPISIKVTLKEKLDELKAVMVTAGTFEAGDKKRAATVLNTLDILTTGGANADISAVVKTLPGAQQVGESEGLFVRGGTGYETKQFIDGTVVSNPFYSSVPDLAQRGRFSPGLFKGTVFSTGGYSALYGQALSSALILESIDLPDESEVNVSISPIFLGVGTQQLAKNKKSSWGTNYNYTNLIAYFKLVKQSVDYFTVPQFHTVDFNYRVKTKRGIFKYYTSFGNSRLGIRRADIDSIGIKDAFALQNNNWYNNLSYKENLGRGWKLSAAASYSTNRDDINNDLQDQNNKKAFFQQDWLRNKNFELNSRQDLSQLRAVFEKRLKGISNLRFGTEYWYGYNQTNYNGKISVLKDHYQSVFAETDVYITNDVALKMGARSEYSSIINKVNVAPRLSIAYKTGKQAQVSLAYGTFYQKPENIHLFNSTSLGYVKATHYIANYQKTTNFYTFRVEGFYKKYDDLIKTSPVLNNTGEGFAKGIEVFWRDKKSIKNLDYWISYSYLDTKRDFLNYPQQLQPNFAAKHTTSFVTKRWVSKLSTGFNFTYSYATGRPYYNFQYSSAANKFVVADNGFTKDFHNLGFSTNYVRKIKNAYTVFVASVTNVLGSNQVYGYNYSYNGMNKQAITPPAKRFIFVGVFISWGVDRTQDAINNNL